MADSAAKAGTPRSAKLLIWATLPVFLLAAFVQATGIGIDLLLLTAVILVVVALERSVGDWLAEWFGPLSAALIFGTFVLALAWYFLSSELGKPQTDRFFIEAERRGYRTVYYETPVAVADNDPAGQHASPASTTGGGSSPEIDRDAGRTSTSRKPRSDTTTDTKQRQEPTESKVAPTNESGSPTTQAIRSIFRRTVTETERKVTTLTVTVMPSTVRVAQRAIITAIVSDGSGRVSGGTVEFTVNGLGAGRHPVGSDGVASTAFTAGIAGTYEVRARFSGTPSHTSRVSGVHLFEVMPSR